MDFYEQWKQRRCKPRHDSSRSISCSVSVCPRLRKRTDIAVMLAGIALCGLNPLIRPYLEGIPALISDCWFKDVFGASVFAAYTDLLICCCGKKYIPQLSHILLLMLLSGFFWEVITPLYRSDTVGDPIDVIAYCLGGSIYCFAARLSFRRCLQADEITSEK